MHRWLRGFVALGKKKRIMRLLTMISSVLLLFTALLVLIQFYPYSYNFTAYPKLTHTVSGADGDPINMVFVGSKDQIRRSFQQAGWFLPDPISAQTAEKIAVDSISHRSYPTAPVSNLYVFGRVQDMAFEKPTNDVQKRGHIRLWKTAMTIHGQLVWLGQASDDRGIELSGTNHLPTHHIAPTVDVERNAVGTDLEKTGLVNHEFDAAFTHPLLYAQNGGGDYYESDGDVLIIRYTDVSISLTQQGGLMHSLKNDVFIFYDTLLAVLNTIGINL